MYHAKPTGVPALISIYEKLAKDNPLLRQLKAAVADAKKLCPWKSDR